MAKFLINFWCSISLQVIVLVSTKLEQLNNEQSFLGIFIVIWAPNSNDELFED